MRACRTLQGESTWQCMHNAIGLHRAISASFLHRTWDIVVNRVEACCKVQQGYSQYHLWKHGHFYSARHVKRRRSYEEAGLKLRACAIVLKDSCKLMQNGRTNENFRRCTWGGEARRGTSRSGKLLNSILFFIDQLSSASPPPQNGLLAIRVTSIQMLEEDSRLLVVCPFRTLAQAHIYVYFSILTYLCFQL